MKPVTEKEAFSSLAAAIVIQACEDYGRAWRMKEPRGCNTESSIHELEKFFRSDICYFYSGTDGEEIIQAVRQRAEEAPRRRPFKLSWELTEQ